MNDNKNKIVLDKFRSARNCVEGANMSMRISPIVVNSRHRMTEQLKEIFRVGTVFSHIFFDKDIPVRTERTLNIGHS